MSLVDHTAADFLTSVQWKAIEECFGLSPRESQILRAAITGATEAAIGECLHISPHTVHTHMRRLYRKTGARDRIQLVLRVFEAYTKTS